MSKISKSPTRHTFQQEGYIKRCKEKGTEPNPAYLEMYETWREQDEAQIVDPAWQKNNMEHDLRSTKWICNKTKDSDNYAQNLYASMCNMDWQKQDVFPILKDERWSCSWRHAGGIIADMREEGDYIDWYCSGIGNKERGFGLDGYEPVPDPAGRDYVPEGVITKEVAQDLLKLGWIPVGQADDDK